MSGRNVVMLLVAVGILATATVTLAADPAKSPRGHEVFDKWCAPCHGRGPDKPGTVALAALYQGAKPAMLEERSDMTPEIVERFVRTGVSIMPFFRKTEISDADLDALALYLASTQAPPK